MKIRKLKAEGRTVKGGKEPGRVRRGERETGAPYRERKVQTRRLGFLQLCLPSPPHLGARKGPVVGHARALASPGASWLLSPPAPQADTKQTALSPPSSPVGQAEDPAESIQMNEMPSILATSP